MGDPGFAMRSGSLLRSGSSHRANLGYGLCSWDQDDDGKESPGLTSVTPGVTTRRSTRSLFLIAHVVLAVSPFAGGGGTLPILLSRGSAPSHSPWHDVSRRGVNTGVFNLVGLLRLASG